MKKIANKNAKEYVIKLEPFEGGKLSGSWLGRLYVVISYEWYPLIIWDSEKMIWLYNKNKYSPSTSKQMTQAHPGFPGVELAKDEMRQYVADNKNYSEIA